MSGSCRCLLNLCMHESAASCAGALLGNMKYSRGITMKCHHEKDELVWEALVSLPWQPSYQYK